MAKLVRRLFLAQEIIGSSPIIPAKLDKIEGCRAVKQQGFLFELSLLTAKIHNSNGSYFTNILSI